jgi:hypothetical protein
VRILRKYSEEILGAGIGVMVLGFALVVWFGSSFESLPNYERLALLIPLTFGAFLISIHTFLEWDTASALSKGKAVGIAIGFPILIAGCLAWWIFAPTVGD